MTFARVTALAALSCLYASSARAAPYPAPTPYDRGNGNPGAPEVMIGICGYQADGKTARPCNPGESPPGSSLAATTTPYVGPTGGNTSSVVGTFTQALAADSLRTACTVANNTGTGNQTILLNNGTSTAQPTLGSTSPYVLKTGGGIFTCGGYKGIVWIASTVASDSYAYEGDR